MSKICPHCGAELPVDAKFCPHCGSDAETGWSGIADIDFELPDYDEIVENEFSKPKKTSPIIIVGTILLVIALIFFLVL